MKIYLMRHGEAELGSLDNQRVLTLHGKAVITLFARFLAPLNIKVAHLFHSHKVRAIETATLIGEALSITNTQSMHPALDPDLNIHVLLAELPTWEGDVFLVGHLPYMAKLASFLVTGHEHLVSYVIDPGTLLCFEASHHASHWQLAWMLNPGFLLPTFSTAFEL